MALLKIIHPTSFGLNALHPLKITCLILLSLLLTSCFDSEEDKQKLSEKHLIQSASYLEQGQFGAAMIEARNAIKNSPQTPEGHIALAKCFVALGNHKSAIMQLEQISPEANPDYIFTLAEAYIARGKYKSANIMLTGNTKLLQSVNPYQYQILKGNTEAGLGKLEEAINRYRKARSIEPSKAEPKLRLAEIYIMQNEQQSAQEMIDSLLEENSGEADVILFQAKLALKDKDLEEGEKLLTAALAKMPTTDIMTPKRARVISALAEVLTRLGRSADALIYTRSIAKAYPGAQNIKNQYDEAVTLYKDGKLDKAETVLIALLKETPGHEKAGQLLGIINYFQGDLDEAEYYFSENIDPEISSDAEKQVVALTSLRLNKPEDVLKILGSGIQSSKDPSNLTLYGLAKLSSGEQEEGIKYLRKALDIAPEKTHIYLVLANYFNNATPSQPEKALAEIQRAYKAVPEDAIIHEALVRQQLMMGNSEGAETTVTRVLSKYPKKYSSYLLAGQLSQFKGKTADALNHYQQALTLAPDNSAAALKVAQSQYFLRQWQAAFDSFKKVIELQPGKIEGYKGLLGSANAMNKADSAISFIEQQNAKSPNVTAYIAVALDSIRRGDYAAAEAYRDKANDISENNPTVQKLSAAIWYAKAKQAKDSENYKDAKQFALKGLQLDSESPLLLTLLAESEIKAEQYEQAAQVIEQIKETNEILGLHLQGDLNNAQKYFASALDSYEKAWEKLPSDLLGFKIYHLLGTSGHKEKAEKFLDTWVEALPNAVRARTTRSAIYIQQGQLKAAQSDLEAGLVSAPNSPVMLNNLAWIYQQLNDSRALGVAERAYKLAPGDANILDTYGWILAESGQNDRAIPILEKALEKQPDNEEIKKHLEAAKTAH